LKAKELKDHLMIRKVAVQVLTNKRRRNQSHQRKGTRRVRMLKMRGLMKQVMKRQENDFLSNFKHLISFRIKLNTKLL